ncbi:MAG: hypothetical protein EA378_10275 [Phycisphaerales bacterium]|nr:MAG: hypothetical protein EA378_10275 [Phycisphaerales bacterium]
MFVPSHMATKVLAMPDPQRASRPSKPAPRTRRPVAAAVRSGLRRYPAELLASLRPTPEHGPLPVRDVLLELAPHGLAAAWLGHASVLATMGELTVAVDPVLSTRIGPRLGARVFGLSRRTPLPIDAASLRGIDAVLITHAHFDHLDRPTLARLADPRTTVIVPPRCARLIPRGFKAVIELPAGEAIDFHGVELRALMPRHWGARAWLDRRRGFNAYILRSDDAAALFAGDTAETDVFDNLDGIDLAAFGIGAYEPWEHMHATPEQVWRMFLASGARRLLPVHHSTFELSDEPMHEPITRLMNAAGDDAERVIVGEPGEIVVVEPPR